GYLDFVVDQLGRRLDVRSRRMFGGVGIYTGDLFFALISQDTLYFKVDDTNRPRHEAAGTKPSRPYGDDRGMSYFSVPAEVLEDADALAEWAAEAVEVARHAKKGRTKKSRTKRR